MNYTHPTHAHSWWSLRSLLHLPWNETGLHSSSSPILSYHWLANEFLHHWIRHWRGTASFYLHRLCWWWPALQPEQLLDTASLPLHSYGQAANISLHPNWKKTKLQNCRVGPTSSPSIVDCGPVEAVSRFTYLSSAQLSYRQQTILHSKDLKTL